VKKLVILIACIFILSISCRIGNSVSDEEIQETVVAGIEQTQEVEEKEVSNTQVSIAATEEAVSLDDGWICFVDGSDIWVMRTDGSQLKNITNTEDIKEIDPRWSWDGTRIVYTDLQDRLYIINRNGTGRELILDNVAAKQPSWSPDGSDIVYAQWKMRDDKLFVSLKILDLENGTDDRIFENGGYAVISPVMSPDGRFIAFFSNGINVLSMDNMEESIILESDPDYMPGMLSWSNDGKKIAFSAMHGVEYGAEAWAEYADIYTIDADGGNLQNLTNNAPPSSEKLEPGQNVFGMAFNPSWTNSGRIVYYSNQADVGPIFRPHIMNGDGSTPQLLVDQEVEYMDYIAETQ